MKIITNLFKVVLGLAIFASLSFAKDMPKPTLTTIDANGAKVHSFTAYSGDVSNIIELKNSLILVDLQPTKSSTKELEKYIKGLKKPLKAIIVASHSIGKNPFKNVPIYESKNMDTFSKGKGVEFFVGIFSKFFGNDMIKTAKTADRFLKDGANTINNQKIDVTTDIHGFPPTSDLAFEKLGIYYTHLSAKNTHFLIPNAKLIDPLIKKFENIKAKKYKVIISAHLQAIGQSGVDFTLKYLETVKNTLKTAKTKEAFAIAMKKAYPDAKAEKFLIMSAKNLYSPAK